jgi:tRNA threonylcarbamoyl adenosine modification protein YeaZ
MPRSFVLALDAATETCSVAVLEERGGGFASVACREIVGGREPTRRLLVFAGEALAEVGAGPEDLGSIVVGTGPGTFTGVRIAVATARALALALDIPVLGVSTLAALAAEAVTVAAGFDVLAPVVDAHRGQVFGAVYKRLGTAWGLVPGLFAVEPVSLAGEIALRAGKGKTLIVGKVDGIVPPGSDGLEGNGDFGLAAGRVSATYLLQGQECLVEQGAGSAARTVKAWLGEDGASNRRRPGELGSPEAVVPIYVRPPDADLHITKMRDPWA